MLTMPYVSIVLTMAKVSMLTVANGQQQCKHPKQWTVWMVANVSMLTEANVSNGSNVNTQTNSILPSSSEQFVSTDNNNSKLTAESRRFNNHQGNGK